MFLVVFQSLLVVVQWPLVIFHWFLEVLAVSGFGSGFDGGFEPDYF